MTRALVLPLLCTCVLMASAPGAERSADHRKPAIFFWGADVARLQPEFARFLNAQGFEVQWGEPTPELQNGEPPRFGRILRELGYCAVGERRLASWHTDTEMAE